MFFEEEPNSNGYASKLEAYRTDDYSVIIAIQPNDEDDAMLCQSIELNALDIRALADELNRLANEIDEEQSGVSHALRKDQNGQYKKVELQSETPPKLEREVLPKGTLQTFPKARFSNVPIGNISGGSQSQSPEPSSQEKQGSVIPDGNKKKKTADVHARYTKDESGQLQLMTAV